MIMKKEELNKMVGINVTITLFDNKIVTGYLHKTSEPLFKNNPNIHLHTKRYFVADENLQYISCFFRSSHVKKCLKNI